MGAFLTAFLTSGLLLPEPSKEESKEIEKNTQCYSGS